MYSVPAAALVASSATPPLCRTFEPGQSSWSLDSISVRLMMHAPPLQVHTPPG